MVAKVYKRGRSAFVGYFAMKKNQLREKTGNDGVEEIFMQNAKDFQTDASQKIKRRMAIDHMDPHIIGAPVDYSFRKIHVLSELEHGTPRRYRVGIPKKCPSSGKYISSSLWVNSNHLSDLTAVNSLVDVSFNRPEMVAWLDVSFNEIQNISNELLKLKNLKILYLHGNNIKFFIEVAKLKPLIHLRTLTLHGNPIEENPNYRALVMKYLPQLINLDFSLVTRQ